MKEKFTDCRVIELSDYHRGMNEINDLDIHIVEAVSHVMEVSFKFARAKMERIADSVPVWEFEERLANLTNACVVLEEMDSYKKGELIRLMLRAIVRDGVKILSAGSPHSRRLQE